MTHAVLVSSAVRDRLAQIAAGRKEQTGKAVTFGEVIELLLEEAGAPG